MTSQRRLGPKASSISIMFWCHWPGLRLGFGEAVLQTLRLKPDGLMTMGPPCSSYVWINAGTHGRTKERPYGFEQTYVDIGSMILSYWIGLYLENQYDFCSHEYMILSPSVCFLLLRIAARAMLLVIIATVRGAYVCIEQPANSTMKYFPDLVRTGKLIQEILKCWRDQFLSGAQEAGVQRWCLPIFL